MIYIIDQLSTSETLWLLILIIEIGLVLCNALVSRDRNMSWFQPPMIVTVIFLYYTLIGPLYLIYNNDTVDRLVNLRYTFDFAWQGACIALFAFMCAYLIKQPNPKTILIPDNSGSISYKLGNYLNLASLFLFSLVAGFFIFSLINPFYSAEVFIDGAARYDGSSLILGPFANYLNLSINFLVPGTFFLFASFLRKNRNPINLLFWYFVSIGIYTSLGFRYRILLILAGSFCIWFLSAKRKFNPFYGVIGVLFLMIIVGIIGVSRTYYVGLDVGKLGDESFLTLALESMKDAKIFMTTGAVMSAFPSDFSFIGLEPIINTFLLPIPSAFLSNKDTISYITDVTSFIYRSPYANAGAAFLNYAELYMMGGPLAIFVGYFLLGLIYRKLWIWFTFNSTNPLAQAIYSNCLVFLYVVISRGYLPQVAMVFAFTVLPGLLIARKYSKPIRV